MDLAHALFVVEDVVLLEVDKSILFQIVFVFVYVAQL